MVTAWDFVIDSQPCLSNLQNGNTSSFPHERAAPWPQKKMSSLSFMKGRDSTSGPSLSPPGGRNRVGSGAMLWGGVPAMQGQAAFSPGAANNTQEREKVRALAGKVQVLGGGGWGVVV